MGPKHVVFFEKTVDLTPERSNPIPVVLVHVKRDLVKNL